MPGKHALLSPSSSARWLTCPPSARLESKLKDRFGEKSSVYAEEGTKAHAVAELKLRREIGEINDFLFKTRLQKLGDVPNEMDLATDRYVDIVLEKYYATKRHCEDAKLEIETRLNMEPWVPQCAGTGDAVIVSDDILEVLDYKNGSGVPVSAVGNPQARLYGLGGINAYGDLYDFPVVRNTIVQPNLDSVTEETLSREELLDWGEQIKPAARQAWEGRGEFKTSQYCRFCAARAICCARAAEVLELFKTGFEQPGVLPDADIPGILAVIPTAKAWLKDVEDYARNQALLGQTWPGWKLVHGRRPGRKWKDEGEVANLLARAGYTEDQYKEQGLKSVADMEKLLGKSTLDALLSKYITQGEGALTLAPADDSRVEYTSADAALDGLL